MAARPRRHAGAGTGARPGRRLRTRLGVGGVVASLVLASIGAAPGPAGAAAPPDDDALSWLNLHRATAGLPAVADDAALATAAELHSEWMLANDVLLHAECVDDACSAPVTVNGPGGTVPAVGSTVAGHRAAKQSNLFVAGSADFTARHVLEAWLTGPFHAVSLLSPRLVEVGYGTAEEPSAPTGLRYAAALDVLGGTTATTPASSYPIAYPADGAIVSTTSYTGNEAPDPLTPCGGLTAPTGAPILVQLGDHRVDPSTAPALGTVTFGRLDAVDPAIVTPLPFCAYDGTSGPKGYTNPDLTQRAIGRAILGGAGAIVVIPAAPLEVGERYRAVVTAGTTTVRTTFTVGTPDEITPPPPPPFGDVGRYHPFVEEIRWMVAEGLTTGFADGTFRPTLAVSRQAMSSFLWKHAGAPVVACPVELPDVPPGHPFRNPICWMLDEGITTGFADGTFRPTLPVSRQAAAAFLHRLDGSPTGPFPEPGFSDVGGGHPFRTAIAWMVDEGLANGFADGTFKPTAAVSRQAMATFLFRFAHRAP